MPRPKILPENRVRAPRACDSCKLSKIRCDSNDPCANCVRRGREGQCSYRASANSTGRRVTRRSEQTGRLPGHSSPAASTQRAQGLRNAGAETETNQHARMPQAVPTPSSEAYSSEHVSLATPSNTASVGYHHQQSQDSPEEQFIAGPDGEKLYIGENASLSFLDFLRHSLRSVVGETAFTDGSQRRNPMLEPEVKDHCDDEITLTPEDRTLLYESYAAASSGILHIFSPDEVACLLNEDVSAESGRINASSIDRASMSMALAIGAQARSSGPSDHHFATASYRKARSIAFEDMLTRPSVGMVRLFVLLSFFALGACQQTPTSIYLGIASKAAVVLGLHQPMSHKLMHEGHSYYTRLRTWHSLCILDVMTSSLLGRPCTVPRATRHSIHALPLDSQQPAFNAMLKGAALLDDISRGLNRGAVIDPATAEGLLKNFQRWAKDLPPRLRRLDCPAAATLSSSDRRDLIGSLHVSSMYYFSVILITRPFLTRCLMTRLRRRGGSRADAMLDPNCLDLAQVCTTSAVYMGQLCNSLSAMPNFEDLPLDNMSLFKTWALGAGLVLGFAILAGEPRHDFGQAFVGVQRLLDKTAGSNTQSGLYSETLNAFSDTIALYERLAPRQRAESPDRLVEHVFSFEPDSTILAQDVEAAAEAQPQRHDATFTDLYGEMNSFLPSQWADGSEIDSAGWDFTCMQFSDNFNFDDLTTL